MISTAPPPPAAPDTPPAPPACGPGRNPADSRPAPGDPPGTADDAGGESPHTPAVRRAVHHPEPRAGGGQGRDPRSTAVPPHGADRHQQPRRNPPAPLDADRGAFPQQAARGGRDRRRQGAIGRDPV